MFDSITEYLQAEHLQAEDIEIFLRTMDLQDWMIFFFSRLQRNELTDLPFSDDKLMCVVRAIECAHNHHITREDQRNASRVTEPWQLSNPYVIK